MEGVPAPAVLQKLGCDWWPGGAVLREVPAWAAPQKLGCDWRELGVPAVREVLASATLRRPASGRREGW
jgi:hypothetical protein